MASTHRHTSAYAYAARTLILLTMSTTVFGQGQGSVGSIVYKGCYKSSQPLVSHGINSYQSNGACQQTCVNASMPVFGLTDKDQCWCGKEIPATSSRVSDSNCNEPCVGYPPNTCGGNGYWTVFLTGADDNVPTFGGSPSSPSGGASSTSDAPSVVTSVVRPGKTVVKIVPASGSEKSGGGANSAAIAAGVIVALVVVSGAAAGVYFWLRHRRRAQTEEEHKRTQIVDFIRNGERKPPPTGYSSTSDSRLDPEFGIKRNSHGSIADNQDFSRKILRVANPDRS